MRRAPSKDSEGSIPISVVRRHNVEVSKRSERNPTVINDTEQSAFWQAPYLCPPVGRGRLEQVEQMAEAIGADKYLDTLTWIKETGKPQGRILGQLHLHLWQTLNRRRM